MWAAGKGEIEAMTALLEKGSDVNASDDSGATALLRAAGSGHLEAVKMLLDKGADLGTRDGDGSTALMWAASNTEHTKVVELLVEQRSRR